MIEDLDGTVKEGLEGCNNSIQLSNVETKASLDLQCEDYKKKIEELRVDILKDVKAMDKKIEKINEKLDAADTAHLSVQVTSLESQVARLQNELKNETLKSAQ